MKAFRYLAAGILFCVAAASVWFFFQNPANIAWLINAFASSIASVVLPSITKRKSPEAEKADNEAYRRGTAVPSRWRRKNR